jgi:signal transduction histidine kinase
MILLNDILDLSKVEAGRFEPEASVFCPGELLTQVAESVCRRGEKPSGLQLSGRWQGPAGQHLRGDVTAAAADVVESGWQRTQVHATRTGRHPPRGS